MLPSNKALQLLKISGERSALFLSQRASICHVDYLEPARNTYHWPYEEKPFTWYNCWKDPFTRAKFNENTKLIQIEGNINAGKQDFAHKLAKQLGMHVLGPIDIDRYYVNNHGYDYRALNPLLPERLRLCDTEMFHENPARHSSVHMMYIAFKTRLLQHIKALQHIFNTGQGVIMIRSPMTERVFVDAMDKIGWLPKGYVRSDGVRFYDFKNRHIHIRNMSIRNLMHPHLTIYLNTPIDVCLERTRNSIDPIEANSRALVPEFLEAMEQSYRDFVLPKVDYFGHLLEYDTPELMTDEQVSEVVDHISELDFQHDDHDTKFEAWAERDQLCSHFLKRFAVTTEIGTKDVFNSLCCDWQDIAGLGDSISINDLILRESLFEAHVGQFGLFTAEEHDRNIHGWLKSIYGRRKTLAERLDDHLRSDYV